MDLSFLRALVSYYPPFHTGGDSEVTVTGSPSRAGCWPVADRDRDPAMATATECRSGQVRIYQDRQLVPLAGTCALAAASLSALSGSRTGLPVPVPARSAPRESELELCTGTVPGLCLGLPATSPGATRRARPGPPNSPRPDPLLNATGKCWQHSPA